MKLSIMLIIVGFIALQSNAALADGNELLAECQLVINYLNNGSAQKLDAATAFKQGQCLGLGQGVRNTMYAYSVLSTELHSKLKLICLPKRGISNGQATRILVSYLKKHPNELQKNETTLAMDAFIDAYPCK